MTLEEFLGNISSAALGLSGGVDSAYLLYEAVKNGVDVQPYFIKTAFQPESELSDAKKLTDRLGIPLKVIEYDILQNEDVACNGKDRCYHCKKALFNIIIENALKDRYDIIFDGTNASDDIDDRPGYKALKELGVVSPLRECGITKIQIRERAKKAGIETWDKPAYSCLATRVQRDNVISEGILHRIYHAEEVLSKLGFSDFRVRQYYEAAKIEVRDEQFDMVISKRDEIIEHIKPYFNDIFFDIKGR
ncbi:MAG: ATP-dependent sacrificial sulfur transferase LarE [Lachnospiraceae bacterium]|nr:ATP-dependent sacrificial sulfur transferase LarE [Lachnospiraceae bacterium]